MTDPLQNLKFRYSWRDYQERILRELEGHLDDGHLHVVAAPGSGKTILGLEVMRKIGRPSLILAPTITVRNQWTERLVSMFLPAGTPQPDWVSKDLRDPGYVTVVTYQALHAAFSGENEDEMAEDEEETSSPKQEKRKSEKADIIALLQKRKISTIILDEAHHLRKEWWKALTDLKAGLENAAVVSLTATPPYDVDYKEWQRYEELCGPIDAEISVPELVKRGELCPHQDYVYFSLPGREEAERIGQFKNDLRQFVERLKDDRDFLAAVSAHPWVSATDSHIESILSEPRFFSSIIIFLNACGFRPPRRALNILGIDKTEIPGLDAKWLEIFLTGFLYAQADQLPAHKEKLDSVREDLKRIGAIELRKVVLDNTKDIQSLLAGSLGKLESIIEIARMESENLGDNLRMVVLADYIRKAELPKDAHDLRPAGKIGVVPIFECLRRANIPGIRLGVLTGSVVFIPIEARPLLERTAEDMGVAASRISYTPVVHDENYVRVDIQGRERQKIVQLVTAVFNAGGITALVGTQALLGEGWDAPSVNTLVLASYVGSYMLSNQMRGRAIRVDPARPGKTANVWHLAAVDLETVQERMQSWFTGQTVRKHAFDPFDDVKKDLGPDVDKLARRFKAFEGLSYDEPPVIENGIKRLGLSNIQWNEKSVGALNRGTMARARAREMLPRLWDRALQGASPRPDMREQVAANAAPTGLAFMDTLKYMAMNAILGGIFWGAQIFNGNRSGSNFFIFLMIGLGIAAAYALPRLAKALYLWVRNGTLENSIKQVSLAVLDGLRNKDLVKTAPAHLRVSAVRDKMGVVHCRLDGATTIEKRHFLDAMQDVLGPVDNPRYLLVRHSYLGRLLRVDYHPVPDILGQNKADAEFFAKRWGRYVGTAKLVYTRTVEGRILILQARTKSLSSVFRKKTDRVSIWE